MSALGSGASRTKAQLGQVLNTEITDPVVRAVVIARLL
jgi:hypothetical protein